MNAALRHADRKWRPRAQESGQDVAGERGRGPTRPGARGACTSLRASARRGRSGSHQHSSWKTRELSGFPPADTLAYTSRFLSRRRAWGGVTGPSNPEASASRPSPGRPSAALGAGSPSVGGPRPALAGAVALQCLLRSWGRPVSFLLFPCRRGNQGREGVTRQEV